MTTERPGPGHQIFKQANDSRSSASCFFFFTSFVSSKNEANRDILPFRPLTEKRGQGGGRARHKVNCIVHSRYLLATNAVEILAASTLAAISAPAKGTFYSTQVTRGMYIQRWLACTHKPDIGKRHVDTMTSTLTMCMYAWSHKQTKNKKHNNHTTRAHTPKRSRTRQDARYLPSCCRDARQGRLPPRSMTLLLLVLLARLIQWKWATEGNNSSGSSN